MMDVDMHMQVFTIPEEGGRDRDRQPHFSSMPEWRPTTAFGCLSVFARMETFAWNLLQSQVGVRIYLAADVPGGSLAQHQRTHLLFAHCP